MEKNRINIAEMLKDCPKGMELDCVMYDNLYFKCIREHPMYPIVCYTVDSKGEEYEISFNWYGKYAMIDTSKCIIFPKGKTTWEGFVPPCVFKDGDILATDLGSVFYLNTRLNTDECYGCYVGIGGDGSFHICGPFAYKECCGFATEDEKQKLFDAIKANGYKWNSETNTLEKLITPKFKAGNKVRNKNNHNVVFTITSIEEDFYACGVATAFWFDDQDDYELVPDKFDITTLKPFDEVLVRNTNNGRWRGQFYMSYDKNEEYPFECAYNCWKQCIPYENNEHLFDKTDDCTDYFKTWE